MNAMIETPAVQTRQAPLRQQPLSNDRDIAEVAIGMGKMLGARTARDFGTTTFGEVTYRKVDPLEEPFRVADARLQVRLEELCDLLRAKY